MPPKERKKTAKGHSGDDTEEMLLEYINAVSIF
jgi:hypothetical protein